MLPGITDLSQVKQVLQLEGQNEGASNSPRCKNQWTISNVDETIGGVMFAAWML